MLKHQSRFVFRCAATTAARRCLSHTVSLRPAFPTLAFTGAIPAVAFSATFASCSKRYLFGMGASTRAKQLSEQQEGGSGKETLIIDEAAAESGNIDALPLAAEERTLSELSQFESQKIETAGADAIAAASGSPIFDSIDGAWATLTSLFSFRSFGLIDSSCGMVITLQTATGLPWAYIFMSTGFALRLLTLYCSLYSERATRRMEYAMCELKPAMDDFQDVYYDPCSSMKEIQIASSTFRIQKKEILKRYETSNLRAAVTFLASPALAWGFMTVLRLCNNNVLLAEAPFLWLETLSKPDPTRLIPCFAVVLTYGNIAAMLYTRFGKTNRGYAKRVCLGILPIAIGVIPAVSLFRAGIVLYWIGISFGSLLQPSLMSSKTFRRYFKVPEPIKPVDSEVGRKPVLSRWQMSLPQMMRDFISRVKRCCCFFLLPVDCSFD